MSPYTLYACFFLLGVVTDFTSLTEMYYLKDLGYSVEQILEIGYWVNISWSVRFVFGAIFDYHAVSSIQMLQFFFVCVCICWYALSSYVLSFPVLFTLLCLCEVAPAAGIVILDATMIRQAQAMEDGSKMAQYSHAIRLCGKIFANICASQIQQTLGSSVVFRIQAVLCVLCAFMFAPLVSFLSPPSVSSPSVPKETLPKQTLTWKTQLYEFVFVDDAFPFIAFLFCVSMLPSATTSVFFFLSGPLELPASFFGLLDATDLLSLIGICFVFPSLSISQLCYLYMVCYVLSQIPIAWMIVRQHLVDEQVLLVLISMIMSFLSSSLMTRFSMENVSLVPKQAVGMRYALYMCAPNAGRAIGASLTLLYTDYFHINHTHFEHLFAFQAISMLYACFVLFVPIFM